MNWRLVLSVRFAVERLIERSECPIFLTLGFADNLTDFADAHARWDSLLHKMRWHWPSLCGVGVWQRQKRGCWHLHAVLPARVTPGKFRALALESGFGVAGINFERIEKHWKGSRGRGFWTPDQVAVYMTRYLFHKDKSGLGHQGVQRVCYWGNARVANCKFEPVGGFRELFLRGLPYWRALGHDSEDTFELRQNWEKICQLGFQYAGREHQERFLKREKVRLWFEGHVPRATNNEKT